MLVRGLVYDYRDQHNINDFPLKPPALRRTYACRKCSCGNYYEKKCKYSRCDDCIIRRSVRRCISKLRNKKIIQSVIRSNMIFGIDEKVMRFLWK